MKFPNCELQIIQKQIKFAGSMKEKCVHVIFNNFIYSLENGVKAPLAFNIRSKIYHYK